MEILDDTSWKNCERIIGRISGEMNDKVGIVTAVAPRKVPGPILENISKEILVGSL